MTWVIDAQGRIKRTAPSVVGNISLTSAGGWPSTTSGCAEPEKIEYTTNDVDMYVSAFDQSADEFAQWMMPMPGDWDGGTLTAQFYWTCNGGGGGQTIEFNIQGRSYGDGEAIDQAWGVSVAVADTWIADDTVHITAITAAITLAGTPAAGELVQMRVWFDVSDSTLGTDAQLLAVRITFLRT